LAGLADAGAVRVEVWQDGDGFRLYRAAEPYFIKGAVYWADPCGAYPLAYLKECGANSVRSGGRFMEKILDEAAKLEMTVTVSLLVEHEYTGGFNYDDEEAVKRQHERIMETVKKYKDNPAILIWGVGNEWSYGYKNEKVFDAVEHACRAIKEMDGNHPTMTAIGDNPFDANFIGLLKKKCPHLDILGVNMYGVLKELPGKIRGLGWDKGYVMTEWGPAGYWQVEKTAWKSEIEQTSSEKAMVYKRSYEEGILKDKQRCLGSYVFLWGQKQEHTHTWFGLFLETGERTEAAGLMQYLWTGRWPANRAPQIGALTIDGKRAVESVYLQPGTSHTGKVDVNDPDGDKVRIEWEVLPEPKGYGYAGRGEKRPAAVTGLKEGQSENGISFKSPKEEGAYRLFVTVYDGKGNAGTGNVPFYVRGE
jgi:hypothetical protein